MHYLVVSPIPLFPTMAGNRSLVLAMVRQIRAAGHRVSFIYSIQETDAIRDSHQTVAEVDALYFHDYDFSIREAETARALVRMSLERTSMNYDLDSWYPAHLNDLIKAIYARDPFDVILSNYIWMSEVFAAVPASVIKIQQTHDSMSDRMLKLAQQGMEPSFFSVKPEDEGRALDRADINISLQYSEELFFHTLTHKIVRTLQHAPSDVPFVPRALPVNRKIRVGFIGSHNAINIKTVSVLVDALTQNPAVAEKIELCVAGNICKIFNGPWPFLRLLGPYDNLSEIYGAMDVMVNPVVDGTGLKIKSVEALQYHAPIIMTCAGSEGLMSPYPFHRCATVTEVLDYLKMIADDPSLLTVMQSVGVKVLNAYRDRLAKAADALIAPQKVIDEHARRTAQTREILWDERVITFYQSPTPLTALSIPPKIKMKNIAAAVPPFSTWVDIGSRCGEFAIVAALAFQASKVIVVEFDPDYIEQLKLNVMRNRLHDVIDMRMLGYAPAVASGYGFVLPGDIRSIAVFDEGADLNPDATIPFAPIDQLLGVESEINVINVDVADPLQTLAALKNIIAKYDPALFVHASPNMQFDIQSWAQQNGYGSARCQINEYDGRTIVSFIPASRGLDTKIVNVA